MPSSRKITDFFVKVGTISAVLVCGGLFVKIFLIVDVPRTLLCEQSEGGATGVAKRSSNIVDFEINYPDRMKQVGTYKMTFPVEVQFTCAGIFGTGWTDAFSDEN